MAAGSEKQAIGERRGVGQPRRQRVRLQMVDRDQRLAVRERDRFGHGQADDDAADQAGTGRRGDAVERGKGVVRIAHCLGDDGIECLDMRAGGNFRHDAAERGMLVDLRENHVGQNAAVARLGPFDQGSARLIAGRLNAEDDHVCTIGRAVIAWP